MLWNLFLLGLTTLPFCDDLHLRVLPYEYRSVNVVAVDYETGRPLPNARISVSYSDTYYFNEPKSDFTTTDAKGMGAVKTAIGTSDWWVSCGCRGYFDSDTNSERQLTLSEQPHATFRLKKTPPVSLIVPNGYKGAIKFTYPMPTSSDSTQDKKPRREYVFRANAKGDVNIESMEISYGLQYVLSHSCLTARYQNGKQVPSEDSDGIRVSTIAIRHVAMWYPALKTKKNRDWTADDFKIIQEIYVIGTDQDRQALYKSLEGVDRIGVNFDFDIRSVGTDEPSAESPKFRGIATLKSPEPSVQNGKRRTFEPFRSAAIRFPWVYLQTRANDRDKAQLFVFRLPAETSDGGSEKVQPHQNNGMVETPSPKNAENHPAVKVDFSFVVDGHGRAEAVPIAPKALGRELKPLGTIDDVGDGYCMVRWDNVLLCTRDGGLEVYSLDDPSRPRRLSKCEPSSKKAYLATGIVRSGNRAFVVGNHILLCYDLSDLSKPRCVSEQAIRYRARCGCLAAGYLYLGGAVDWPEGMEDGKGRAEATTLIGTARRWSRSLDYVMASEGIGVFDATDPTKVKEVSFLPMSQTVYHVFALPGDHELLASLDADSACYTVSSDHITVHGKSAFISLAKPIQPALVKESNESGGRMAVLLPTQHDNYFVCDGVTFAIQNQQLHEAYSFFSPGGTCDGFPYYGDSDGTYAVLPLDYSAVVIRVNDDGGKHP